MIEFRQIEIPDKSWIDELLKYSDYRGAEYCFTNLFIWDGVYKSKIARYKEFLLFRSGEGDTTRYLYPAGRGDKREAIEYLIEDAKENGHKFILIGLSLESKAELNELLPDRFEFKPVRDSFDYIYESERLITLSGKKLQSKRNHINRFKELPDWQYEELTDDKIGEIIDFTSKWCKDAGCDKNESLGLEACAVAKCLSNYPSLNLKGGILRLDEEIVAYTIGEPINSDTVIIHIEKAFADVRGAYPMINREFAERVASGYKYINREDDAGDAGLRKAKESYYPVFMQEKYAAFLF
ncbi:MAG: phosphatidylglycerol lysyltransferase domain-containing protein [Bacteroidales bacterium]